MLRPQTCPHGPPSRANEIQSVFLLTEVNVVQEQPGTGLGLSITRNLVAFHQGEFSIESEPGQGSTFAFSVPIAELAAGPDSDSA